MFFLLILYTLNTFPLTAAILPYTKPLVLLGLRMSIAGILLLGYIMLRKKMYQNKDHYSFYIKIIVFAVFLPYILRYYGLQHAATPRAYLLYNLGPVITYLVAPYWTQEEITWQRTGALILSFIGMILFLGNPLTAYCATPLVFADFALLASTISFCYGWAVMRNLIVNLNYAPALANGIAMFGGGILGLLAALCIETPPYVYNLTYFIVILTGIILISNVIAHNLYATLLHTYSLTLIQLGYWLSPIIAHVGQALFLQHTLSIYTCISGALICIGFIWMYKQESTLQVVSFSLNKVQCDFNGLR